MLEQRPFEVWGGAQLRDLTYVDDVTEAFLLAADSPECHGRIFNIGGPPPVSLHDIAELMVRVAGPPARYITREFPADRATIDIGSYHADDSAFRAAAGWEPRVGLEEGIRRSSRWCRFAPGGLSVGAHLAVRWVTNTARGRHVATNAPDPAMREAVVQQDLKNVLHPIVQHKALESKQMVVTGGAGLDDLRRRWHRLSRRHGRALVRQYRLRPHRTGRSRRRADAATVLFPAYRDERARRGAGREDQQG